MRNYQVTAVTRYGEDTTEVSASNPIEAERLATTIFNESGVVFASLDVEELV